MRTVTLMWIGNSSRYCLRTSLEATVELLTQAMQADEFVRVGERYINPRTVTMVNVHPDEVSEEFWATKTDTLLAVA